MTSLWFPKGFLNKARFCLAKHFNCSQGKKDVELHVSLTSEVLGKEATSSTWGGIVTFRRCVVCLVVGHHLLNSPSLEIVDMVPVWAGWCPSPHLWCHCHLLGATAPSAGVSHHALSCCWGWKTRCSKLSPDFIRNWVPVAEALMRIPLGHKCFLKLCLKVVFKNGNALEMFTACLFSTSWQSV